MSADNSSSINTTSSAHFSLTSSDRALEEQVLRQVHLVVAKTLSQLRQKSHIHLNMDGMAIDGVDDDDDDDYDKGLPRTLILGAKLGEGGFSSVHDVVGEPTLACKVLSTETIRNRELFFIAAADIVREAYFLSHLSHPNIITLRGVGSLDDMSQYYLLLDKIYAPLSSKIDEWDLATTDNHQIPERLQYAMAIVKAMVYLHSHHIVYRDLKVDNIGLNAKNQVLLYDFGLAKELKGPHDANGKYKLSGNTGSWAYMAPEVAKGYKYNASVDVYSFGILLWELLSGKYAFDGMSSNVVDKEVRPPFLRTWPASLESLLTECWHWNPSTRPAFVEIEERLNAIMEELGPNKAGNFFSWIMDGTARKTMSS